MAGMSRDETRNLMRGLVEEATAGLGVWVSVAAVKLYCLRNGLPKINPGNLDQTLRPAVEALRIALEGWDGTADTFPDPLHPGALWACGGGEEGRWVRAYVSADRSIRRRPEEAA
ncbi:hypothetical protein [Streptomyces sp. NPDC059278]|uniref:hypothetical protein n=1 Tax=Streptomyces sp. NPDC059278 TaxID=3346801 RepID=UPI003687E33B